MADAAELFGAWRPISLDAMNERAALQRRADTKYAIDVEQLFEVRAAGR
jgi:hypothetical protein